MHKAIPRTVLMSALLTALCSMTLHAEPVPMNPPAEASIPQGPIGDAIKLGKLLVMDTRKQLPKNVGGGLNCSNCHLGGGTVANAGPYVGLWGMFPEYRTRSDSINSLQERINDCFERSMNGHPLEYDSKEMNAMLMYMQWLSTGVPVGTPVVGRGMGKINKDLVADVDNGKHLYEQKCVACHAVNGEGVKNADGSYSFPPVWGNASFNVGAGMARTYTAAAFIKHNMPLGQGNTLSDQDAVDIAAYFTHQPRPAFAGAKNDYAGGNKPKDARN